MQIRRRFMADCTEKPALSDDDESEDKRKIFCGNLSEKVTGAILFELFLQAGPVESVEIPKSKDGRVRNYAFITYVHVSSVPYALRLFADVKLYNRRLVLRNRTLSNGGTNSRSNQANDPVVNDIPYVRSECQKVKSTRNSCKLGPARCVSEQQPPQSDKDDPFIRKLGDLKKRLPRIPLRVSNECRTPKKVPANLNRVLCQEIMPSISEAEQKGSVADTQPTENSNNLPSTLNLTSQFLNNYIYLMQKVIPQWPRLQ